MEISLETSQGDIIIANPFVSKIIGQIIDSKMIFFLSLTVFVCFSGKV